MDTGFDTDRESSILAVPVPDSVIRWRQPVAYLVLGVLGFSQCTCFFLKTYEFSQEYMLEFALCPCQTGYVELAFLIKSF